MTKGKAKAKKAEPTWVDTIDCPECGLAFTPTKEGQKTCGRPACCGGMGARARNYRKRDR